MPYTVKIPTQVNLPEGTVANKQVSVGGNDLHLTVYAQAEETGSGSVVAGPTPFTAHVNKTRPDARELLKNMLVAKIKAWAVDAKQELACRETDLADLETELETEVNE